MSSIPLLPVGEPAAIVADYRGQPISRALFLSHIFIASAALPENGHVLNLCNDR